MRSPRDLSANSRLNVLSAERPGLQDRRPTGSGEVEQALELLDAHHGPRARVARQEGRRRVLLLEVLDDGARLVEHERTVGEGGHLAMRTPGEVLGALVLALLEAQEDGLVGQLLLLEHELDPPREGRTRAVVEVDHGALLP